jgi:hypothetical protein
LACGIHTGLVAAFSRALFLILVNFVVATQSACVGNRVAFPVGAHAKDLALQLDIPGCRLSRPLRVEDVLQYARDEDMPLRDPDDLRRRLEESAQSGSEIRVIDCRRVDRRGLIEGTRYIATIKDGKVEHVVLDEIVN